MIKVTNVRGNFTTNQTELRSEENRPENIKIQSIAQRTIPTWMKISTACGILAAFGVIAYKNEWFSFNGFNIGSTSDNLKKQCESTLPDTYKLDPSATAHQNQDFVSIGNSFDGQNGIGCVWSKAGQETSLSAGEFQDSQLIKGIQLVGSMNEEGQLHGDNCVKIEKKSADPWASLTKTTIEKRTFEVES